MNKTDYKKILAGYFADKPDVLCAYIFGSAARGKETAHSDVDIAVLFNDSVSSSEYTERQISLFVDLSELLCVNVDIIVLNQATPYLRFQVIQSGVKVYENPKRKDRAFEARSIVEFFDFLPLKNLLESSVLKRIKEG